jgi:glycosyltransferase involved in cell wall biosynthesis
MFFPFEPNKEIFEELQISNQDVVVGMASSFRWYNDIDELCSILSKASMKIDHLKSLIIVGDQNKEFEIQNKIIQYNLQDKTKILSQVPFEKMPSILNCCDILISHFNFHGKWPHNCSIKHLEYLSSGKPTVATDVGEVNFAIEHQVNGILCQEGNIEQFANSIADLAINYKLRSKLGNLGRKKAIKELTWEANITRILNFLNENHKIS